jgi:hypothetical protein
VDGIVIAVTGRVAPLHRRRLSGRGNRTVSKLSLGPSGPAIGRNPFAAKGDHRPERLTGIPSTGVRQVLRSAE